ncbi:MAG TPA: hypothetical protein VF257_04425 [Solirubrobacteraceae bacterium]
MSKWQRSNDVPVDLPTPVALATARVEALGQEDAYAIALGAGPSGRP